MSAPRKLQLTEQFFRSECREVGLELSRRSALGKFLRIPVLTQGRPEGAKGVGLGGRDTSDSLVEFLSGESVAAAHSTSDPPPPSVDNHVSYEPRNDGIRIAVFDLRKKGW